MACSRRGWPTASAGRRPNSTSASAGRGRRRTGTAGGSHIRIDVEDGSDGVHAEASDRPGWTSWTPCRIRTGGCRWRFAAPATIRELAAAGNSRTRDGSPADRGEDHQDRRRAGPVTFVFDSIPSPGMFPESLRHSGGAGPQDGQRVAYDDLISPCVGVVVMTSWCRQSQRGIKRAPASGSQAGPSQLDGDRAGRRSRALPIVIGRETRMRSSPEAEPVLAPEPGPRALIESLGRRRHSKGWPSTAIFSSADARGPSGCNVPAGIVAEPGHSRRRGDDVRDRGDGAGFSLSSIPSGRIISMRRTVRAIGWGNGPSRRARRGRNGRYAWGWAGAAGRIRYGGACGSGRRQSPPSCPGRDAPSPSGRCRERPGSQVSCRRRPDRLGETTDFL